MIRLPPFAWPGVAAALTLLIAGECLMPGPGSTASSRTLVVPAAAPDTMTDQAVGQWGDTSLARPLFHPDRRPTIVANANTGTSLPRLSAIVIIGENRAAIFAADGQKPQVVAAGSSIDGYQLTRITPGSVELLGAGGTVTLRPQFISAAGTASVAPANAGAGLIPGIIPGNAANSNSNNNEEPPN